METKSREIGPRGSLPGHLVDLADGTPLAMSRLLEAWHDLPVADKTTLLQYLFWRPEVGDPILKREDHAAALVDMALADPNSYVRYLAAREVSQPFGGGGLLDLPRESGYEAKRARYERVRADPSPLVRSATGNVEIPLNDSDDLLAAFWAQPHTERLSAVSGERDKCLSKQRFGSMARLLVFAGRELLPAQKVTEVEILDLLEQWLAGEKLAARIKRENDRRKKYGDGFGEYLLTEHVQNLWGAVAALPDKVAIRLLNELPAQIDSRNVIPADVLQRIAAQPQKLTYLLFRDDAELPELRLELYRQERNAIAPDSATTSFRGDAALSSAAFTLPDSELEPFWLNEEDSEESKKAKVKMLRRLASAESLSMSQRAAVVRGLDAAPSRFFPAFSGVFEHRVDAEDAEKRRLSGLSPLALEREVLEYRLFLLACVAAEGQAEGMSDSVKKLVVSEEPWKTFLAFKDACGDSLQYQSAQAVEWRGAKLPGVEVAGRRYGPPDGESDGEELSEADAGEATVDATAMDLAAALDRLSKVESQTRKIYFIILALSAWLLYRLA